VSAPPLTHLSPQPTPTTEVELFSVAGADGILRHVNARFAALLGADLDELEERSVLELVHPEDVPEVVGALAALAAGTPEVLTETRFRQHDGTWVHLEWVARPVPGSDLWWASGRETTLLHRLRAEGGDLRARLQLAVGETAAMWSLDLRTGELTWEPQARSVFGVPVEELPADLATFSTWVHDDDRLPLEAAFDQMRRAGAAEADARIVRPTEVRHVSVRGQVIERDRRKRAVRAVGLVLDVTTARAMEEQMLRMVMSDALTGGPNRRAFDKALRAQWRAATRSTEPLSVLMLDIDDFKQLNDTHGHLVGDAVLTGVWRALSGALHRDGDSVARFGGEEFAVVLPGVDAEGARVVAERCCAAVREVRIDQAPGWRLTVSAGTATRSGADGHEPASATELLGRADEALYVAKAVGKDRVVGYESALSAQAALDRAVRDGLRDDEFVMHYQPVVDLSSGEVTSYEALMRWERPGHGLVGPGAFNPPAEARDLIKDLGRFALRSSTRQAAAWAADATSPVAVAVNLSARHLADAGVVYDVSVALEQSGLPPRLLVVELTETALADDAAVHEHLTRLRNLGVQVAIDDFGTGYTSVGQIPHLPADVLKIDRSFVCSPEPRQRDLVALMVAAAHAFDLRVVAEGVETAEVYEWVRELGCDHAQGYLIARPGPAEAHTATECRTGSR
jgi:diguanylate cyclase (GGDEF)-like protein/PAS domain S-box-containing protein